MPLLLPFRRAGLHEKVVQAVVYPASFLLGAAVLVPFLLAIALSFGDLEDWWSGRKWPDLRHWTSARRLYVHYVATRYDYWLALNAFDGFYPDVKSSSQTILGVEEFPEPAGNWRVRAADGLEALGKMPWTHVRPLLTGWYYWGGGSGNDLAAFTGLTDVAWKDDLRARYGTVEEVNARFDTSFMAFPYVKVPAIPGDLSRGGWPLADAWTAEYIGFLAERLDRSNCYPLLGDRAWRSWLKTELASGDDLARLNAALGTGYATWTDVRVSETVPAAPAVRKFWEWYVRNALSPYFLEVSVSPGLEDAWRRFLLAQHGGEEGIYARYGTPVSRISLAPTAHVASSATAWGDWDRFVRTVPLEAITILSPETFWRRHLRAKYGTPEAVAAAWGVPVGAWETVAWPQAEIDRREWELHRGAWIREILFKNYRRVWRLMTQAAPAIWNTARFSILFALLSVAINAGAAYVLSRYAAGPIQISLVLFLALAAFPIEAIAVPNFLLLREIGLLNTVWALVLPTAVNGYYIYLLKSAFDAIPKAYFEEAMMEGASEWHLFWAVAVPLTRPMLSVVSLYAFLWAYSNFMWALIAGQHRTQWTVPVLLFNMNAWSATPLVAAGIVLALIPPLLVFGFAHRTLQRSLTLPRF